MAKAKIDIRMHNSLVLHSSAWNCQYMSSIQLYAQYSVNATSLPAVLDGPDGVGEVVLEVPGGALELVLGGSGVRGAEMIVFPSPSGLVEVVFDGPSGVGDVGSG